jgi:1-aminocyclopropane-1-carboxylate deaminase
MSHLCPINLSLLGPHIVDSDYRFDVYRGDLENAQAPGNKWHKLQYHLGAATKQNADVIATFGGPFSNHLHAFAKTLKNLPFEAVAVVRGELHPQLTPTLQDMVDDGVNLWPSSRSDYRLGTSSYVADAINTYYRNVYWIPEGGGGILGARGCHDWAEKISHLVGDYDAWVVSAGTGTTAAGLLSYNETPDLHVFSALKGAQAQRQQIIEQAYLLTNGLVSQRHLAEKLFFHADCHEGGYAKHSQTLVRFMRDFAMSNPDCLLDPIYTCKSMFAVMSAMKIGTWPYRRTLFIHTGGMQGWRGYSSDRNPFVLS